ncbi:MFS transporter [Flavobacterium silvaticum]|uniref:MFS transporter n=1 Tax=Flavobacterium silvaticum TaxID=1852020 RepID=A0A972JJ09_9FLAO|nr:MFS transporter [Flavobacterium silvaticum]NMH29625.1 MFS transporter [Flavobacterium silvaticum]
MPLLDYSNFWDKIISRPRYKKSYHNLRKSYLTRIRIAVSLFYFGMGFTFASWASRIPDIKQIMGLDESGLGLILFAIPVGQLVALPFSGKSVTKIGSDKMLPVTLFTYGISLLFLGLAQHPWQLALALFFFGLSGNFCNIAVNTQGVYAEGLFSKPIMGSFHGSWSLAGFFGALCGMISNVFKWTPGFHFAIVLGILTLLILTNKKFLVKVKKPKPTEPQPAFWSGVSSLLIWLGVIALCCRTSEGIMYDWSGVYFREIIGEKGALATLGYTAFMITMTTGRFLSDWLVLRFGRRPILIVSGIAVSIGLMCAVIFPYIVPSTLSFMFVGLGVSTIFPIIFSIAGSRPDVPASLALTIVTSVSFLGFLTGPPLIGLIAQHSSLRISFAFVALFGILIALIVKNVKSIR